MVDMGQKLDYSHRCDPERYSPITGSYSPQLPIMAISSRNLPQYDPH